MKRFCTRCRKEFESEGYSNCVRCREVARRWNQLHPDKVRAAVDRYQEGNHDKYLAGQRRSKSKHGEKRRAEHRVWIKDNPERCKMHYHNRRARLKGNGGSYTLSELNGLFLKQNGLCHYCGDVLEITVKFGVHIDHKTPVSRGGTSYIENIALTCATCNISKGTKTEEEYKKVKQNDKSEI